jgi:hypothetical protein
VALCRVHVDIDPEHPGEEAGVDLLRLGILVVLAAFVTVRVVQEAVGAKEHVAAVVPEVPVELVDEDKLGRRVRGCGAIRHRESGQPVVAGCLVVRRGGQGAHDRAGRVVVIDVDEAPVGRARLPYCGWNARPRRPESLKPCVWALRSRNRVFVAVAGLLSKHQILPSRSQTKMRLVPGSGMKTVGSWNVRFG